MVDRSYKINTQFISSKKNLKLLSTTRTLTSEKETCKKGTKGKRHDVLSPFCEISMSNTHLKLLALTVATEMIMTLLLLTSTINKIRYQEQHLSVLFLQAANFIMQKSCLLARDISSCSPIKPYWKRWHRKHGVPQNTAASRDTDRRWQTQMG